MREKPLTPAQREILRRAAADPEGQITQYATQGKTINRLKMEGLIQLAPKIADKAARENEIREHVVKARKVLIDDGSWTEALHWLNQARRLFDELSEAVWRITPKGREAVAGEKGRTATG